MGVHQFKGAIPKNNLMRGLRLRKENIQIGDEDALQKLFKEDRGNSYFIGEVFALDKNLIPNSQRDYFNQNAAREEFENVLKMYFNDDLYKTYYCASSLNSGYRKIEKFEILQAEFEKIERAGFAGVEHKEKKETELKEAEQAAQKARKDIEKMISKVTTSNPLLETVATIIKKKQRISREDMSSRSETVMPDANKKKTWRVDKLTRLTKQERKLVGRIFDVIFAVVDNDTAEQIVSKIEEAL